MHISDPRSSSTNTFSNFNAKPDAIPHPDTVSCFNPKPDAIPHPDDDTDCLL